MSTNIYKELRTAIIILMIFTVITGWVYPFMITGIAQWFFSEKADGSFIMHKDKKFASSLIGQNFDSPKYFWGRPSATMVFPYNIMATRGSGLSPANPQFIDLVKKRVEILQKAHGFNDKVPVELVEASASGVDPHISPLAAYYQVHRVALARKMTDMAVQELIEKHIESRHFGVLGEPRVNVLKLNLALDE